MSSKQIEIVVSYRHAGDLSTVRERRWEIELPVSRRLTVVEDAAVALYRGDGYHHQSVQVDAGEVLGGPDDGQVCALLRALPAQWAAAEAAEAAEKAERDRVRLEQERADLLVALSEPPAADRVFSDGSSFDSRLRGEVPEDLRGQRAQLLAQCTALRIAESEARAAAERAKEEAKTAKVEARRQYIATWAAEHGSARLKAQLEAGLDGWPLYLHERLAADLGAEVELDNDGGDPEPLINPTIEQMVVAAQLATGLQVCGQVPEGQPAIRAATVSAITFEAEDGDNDGYGAPESETRVYACATWRPGPAELFAERQVRLLCPESD